MRTLPWLGSRSSCHGGAKNVMQFNLWWGFGDSLYKSIIARLNFFVDSIKVFYYTIIKSAPSESRTRHIKLLRPANLIYDLLQRGQKWEVWTKLLPPVAFQGYTYKMNNIQLSWGTQIERHQIMRFHDSIHYSKNQNFCNQKNFVLKLSNFSSGV